jgi:hypothetical protein
MVDNTAEGLVAANACHRRRPGFVQRQVAPLAVE